MLIHCGFTDIRKTIPNILLCFFFVQDCDEDVVTAIMNAKTGIIS